MSVVSESVNTSGNLDILLVENHPDTMKYLKMYLEQSGHSVRTAGTMEEALVKLSESCGNVVISDIGLPDGDGWELLEKASLPESVYAIAMSGFGMGSDRARSKEAGYREHLLKPFTPDVLEHHLERAQVEKSSREERRRAVA